MRLGYGLVPYAGGTDPSRRGWGTDHFVGCTDFSRRGGGYGFSP